MAAYTLLVLLTLFVSVSLADANELARGWGDEIEWVDLKEGMEKAKNENKPLMLVIHKTWCGACKALKPRFAESKEIADLSSAFVMVNAQDEEEPSGKQYTPDGGYIPRILFLDWSGKVHKEYSNEGGNPSYKYYYPQVSDIVKSMKAVKKDVEDGTFQVVKEEL